MELNAETNTPQLEKPAVIYRCKKCRRIIASQENLVARAWEGRRELQGEEENGRLKGMGKGSGRLLLHILGADEVDANSQTVQECYVEEKLLCMGCNARLGSFNWSSMQCNCGAWVDPAFQPHKGRLDECHM